MADPTTADRSMLRASELQNPWDYLYDVTDGCFCAIDCPKDPSFFPNPRPLQLRDQARSQFSSSTRPRAQSNTPWPRSCPRTLRRCNCMLVSCFHPSGIHLLTVTFRSYTRLSDKLTRRTYLRNYSMTYPVQDTGDSQS